MENCSGKELLPHVNETIAEDIDLWLRPGLKNFFDLLLVFYI